MLMISGIRESNRFETVGGKQLVCGDLLVPIQLETRGKVQHDTG